MKNDSTALIVIGAAAVLLLLWNNGTLANVLGGAGQFNDLNRIGPGGPITVGHETCNYIGGNVWCCRNRFTGALRCFNGVAPY